jgi:anti-anti-sigma factor
MSFANAIGVCMFRRHAVHDQAGELRDQLDIRSQRHGHVHVVELTGELDINTAAAFEAELKSVECSDVQEIIVDLSALKFISAEGLKVLIHANARGRDRHNRLKLLRGTDQVHKTFERAGLLTRLPFDDNRALKFGSHHQPSRARLVMSLPIRNWLIVDEPLSPSFSSSAYTRWPAALRRRRGRRSRPRRG